MKFLSFFIFSVLISFSWAQKPNIILVITDDQGFGDFRFSGNQHIHTPNIDKLRNESILLDNFHVDPTCSPTRAALLTGRYSNRTGVWHTVQGRNLLREREITLADILSKNGYKTAIFGKWHLGHNYPYRAQDRGFGYHVIHSAGGVGQAPDYWGNDYFDDTYLVNGTYQKFKGFCTDIWFDEAIRFIKQNKNKPFFAYITTNAPHGPFYCPKNYTKLYENNPNVPNVPFYGMITNIDDNMGKLMSFLDDENLRNNTILIYMTDNGTSAGVKWNNSTKKNIGYNFNMKGKKNSEYEGGHRVPFIIDLPNTFSSSGVKTLSDLTAHIDITPTLIDLCGLTCPSIAFDGISLKNLLVKPNTKLPERTIVVESQRVVTPIKWRKSAVMTKEWRLVNGSELYNIKKDFSQKEDVSKKYPTIVKQLRKEYENYWEEVSKEHHITSHVIIGSDNCPIVKLSSHDWLIDQLTPWSQQHVKDGFCEASAHWSVKTEQAGIFEISLRRWPAEADKPINDGTYGKSYNYTHARLKINGLDLMKEIPTDAHEVTFSVKLPEGIMELAPEFISDDIIATPYYAYVTHKPFEGWQQRTGMNLPLYDPDYGSKPPQIID